MSLDLHDIDTETWQPVVAPRPHNYVPAASPRPAPLAVPDGWNGVATVDMQPVDVTPAFSPVHDGSRDSTSATDRATGYVIRLAPALLLSLLLAVMGMVAFVLIMRQLETPTDALTNFFVFLVCLAVPFLMFAVTVNRTDYQHSRAGVERHRITTAADLRKEEIAAMLDLRREALRHTLQLLESQERRQLSDRN